MLPIEFQQKWIGVTLKERSAAQEHFIDRAVWAAYGWSDDRADTTEMNRSSNASSPSTSRDTRRSKDEERVTVHSSNAAGWHMPRKDQNGNCIQKTGTAQISPQPSR